MKAWFWNILIGSAILAVAIWMYSNREVTEWSTQIPDHLQGHWKLIEERHSDNYGIREIRLSVSEVALRIVFDEKQKEIRRLPVQRTSMTARQGQQIGGVVLFCGSPDSSRVTERRLQIYYGRKQKITVQEIVEDGSGGDHWFDVGEFVKVN